MHDDEQPSIIPSAALRSTFTGMKLSYEFMLLIKFWPPLQGEARSCPELGVMQPLKEIDNTTKKNIAAVKLFDDAMQLFQSNNFIHTFYAIGGL